MKETHSHHPLNYIYFSLLFLFLAILHVYHVLLIQAPSFWGQMLYVAAAVLETVVEVAVASAISLLLLNRRKKLLHAGYLCLLTMFAFLRLADFAVVRLMGVSAWYWIDLILQESFSNFIEMLYATNVKLSVWLIALFLVFGGVALSGLFFYLSNKLSKKKPWNLSPKKLLNVCLLVFVGLGAVDVLLYLSQSSENSFLYSKALPWKRTLLDSKFETIEVSGYLKDPKSQMMTFDQMDSTLFSLERKPDLFLFVVESLRSDFLTPRVTPHLSSFALENHSFSKARSNANGTQLSWFSLFYSMYPFHWVKYQPMQWSQGGMPLSLLKKMGYEVYVYASSRLNYYSMDASLFGEKTSLADKFYEFRVDESLSASETDAQAIGQLCKDIEGSSQKGGRLFIVFLESTHFDYSWPEERECLFLPVEKSIDYISLACRRAGLENVKNRYKNALHYIDELFGSFRSFLTEKGIWEDSVVVFTADHGEEFDEYGSVFHASGLSLPQLQIPLYVKLGKDQISSSLDTARYASQMDIFPTLFHYLAGENVFAGCFQGESLFALPQKDYVVGVRYNASQVPSEFYIQKGEYRLILEFENNRNIFHNRLLKVKALLNEKEEKIPFSFSLVRSQFGDALDQLFSLP